MVEKTNICVPAAEKEEDETIYRGETKIISWAVASYQILFDMFYFYVTWRTEEQTCADERNRFVCLFWCKVKHICSSNQTHINWSDQQSISHQVTSNVPFSLCVRRSGTADSTAQL